VLQVIRGITHIGDKDDFFAGLVRVQKQLSKSGAKVAFTETGLVEINGELHLHPMDFSAIDKAQRQVILDATKNLSEGTWTHQQFNEEVRCIKQLLRLKSIIFWDMTPCSPLSFSRRFGGTYRLHLQVRRNKFSTNQQASRWQAYFFDPEDGGDMFLRNVG
jgi:hypothetical protein